ncbi:cysteine proteinase inhibitor 12-like [Dendrobium catenatum]|uniref:cysteine proteinase inhibitor 12-like n=1 Tax=Dendrobium catenatum TaxID=906689 RepID=UPI00109F41D6|nr:cysteine proteinase inhibitor 12-like [Dendrobium catenatum]
MVTLGGVRDVENNQNSVEIEELARFAVDEHNREESRSVGLGSMFFVFLGFVWTSWGDLLLQNALLEFARVVKAKEQVVAGTLHHLTLEAIDAGIKKLYEAKVWTKPWLNHKELQEFKHTGDGESASFTSADLGAKRDGHETGWRAVPTNDPVVQAAANHAVTAINNMCDCIVTLELLEIQHAKAAVIEDFAKFDLLLRLRRGWKEEKYKVEVHKNVEGIFSLKL